MAKASRSKQPAFDPSELEDLIHSPAVGRGVGSHLLSNNADSPAPPAEAKPLKLGLDLSTVARLQVSVGGLTKLNPSILKLPELIAITTPDLSTVGTPDMSTVAMFEQIENKGPNKPDLSTVVILSTVDRLKREEPIATLLADMPTVDMSPLTTVDTLIKQEGVSLSGPDSTTVDKSTATTVDMFQKEGNSQAHGPHMLTVDTSNATTVDRSTPANPRFSAKVKLWITEQGELIPEGRVKRIRLAQDVINSGEELVYNTLWAAKGSAESDASRVVQAGYDFLAKRTRLAKKTIQRIISKLIDKDFIVIEVPADIYQRTSTVYRVFSYKTVLDRNIQRGRTHVAKIGPGFSYVRPLNTSDLFTVDNSHMPTVANGATVTVDEKNLSTVVNETILPIDKRNLDQLTTTVGQALAVYGMPDDDAVLKLIRRCRQECTDCTSQEIIHFLHQKGTLTRGKRSGITNPIGFLIDAVPKCFAGETFISWRKAHTEPEAADVEPNQAERDLAWGREHEAELNDPTVPEEIKRVIRRCLGV